MNEAAEEERSANDDGAENQFSGGPKEKSLMRFLYGFECLIVLDWCDACHSMEGSGNMGEYEGRERRC